MLAWQDLLVNGEMTLLKAMEVIDRTKHKFVLVVDQDRRLLGSLSDGDIRRSLIRGAALSSMVRDSMNANPFVIQGRKTRRELIRILRDLTIQFAPVVNEKGELIDICLLEDLVLPRARENTIVLMAGGLGSRMGNLTSNTPKPMLKLGEKPILQIILESFRDQGFTKFKISVNYLADVIERYFGDGRQFGVQISYIRESKRLGTAGALSLIDRLEPHPYIVMNADLLSQVSFGEVLDYFEDCKFDALMCVRQHDIHVPFGVVKTDGKLIQGIDEKPTHSFFVNAGIYVLSPEMIRLIPKDTYHDMTHLFEDMTQRGFQAGVFPILGFWRDLGSKEDLSKAQALFQNGN